MTQQGLNIRGIPAIVWGDASDKVYIYVHGKMSQKEEARDFALKAVQRGYQVLSFDLPEHGERKGEEYTCDVWNGVRDLQVIYDYAAEQWRHKSLFGSSLGAYFGLLAYRDCPIEKALFVSPILDMEVLIENMMKWSGVTEAALEEKRTIPTPMGETLYWDYYCYVKQHPIDKWAVPTGILWASKDNLTERVVIDRFVERFNAELTVLEDGEHWFHTEEQLEFLHAWLDGYI